MDPVSNQMDIDMNYTNTDDHVPEAERNIRTIKERVRAIFQRLPFRALPRLMIQRLAMDCVNKLNMFPVKGCVS